MATVCPCASPPGGTINCPKGHFAYCEIQGGSVDGGCIPPASTAKPTYNELVEVVELALSKIPRRRRVAAMQLLEISVSFSPGRLQWSNRGQVLERLNRAMDRGSTVALRVSRQFGDEAMWGESEQSVVRLRFPDSWRNGDNEGGSDNFDLFR